MDSGVMREEERDYVIKLLWRVCGFTGLGKSNAMQRLAKSLNEESSRKSGTDHSAVECKMISLRLLHCQ
jgi:hypothetical protein